MSSFGPSRSQGSDEEKVKLQGKKMKGDKKSDKKDHPRGLMK